MTGIRFSPRGTMITSLGIAMTLALAASAQPTGPAANVEPYQPEIGEIMMFQQLRHAKLWFAGQMNNWPLAD